MADFPLRGSAVFYADTAFSTLRAHATGKPNSQNGFEAVISSLNRKTPTACAAGVSHSVFD
jgi:hypothetical protein